MQHQCSYSDPAQQIAVASAAAAAAAAAAAHQAVTGGMGRPPMAGFQPPSHFPMMHHPAMAGMMGAYAPVPPSDPYGVADAQVRGRFDREDASGRWVLEPEDVLLLERVFALEKCPGRELRAQLAARLRVKPRQVQVWFQNKRQRTKNGAKPTVAEALAHASQHPEQQKEPAELLMSISKGAGAVGGGGEDAPSGVTLAPSTDASSEGEASGALTATTLSSFPSSPSVRSLQCI